MHNDCSARTVDSLFDIVCAKTSYFYLMVAAFQTRVWLLITLGPQLSHRESKILKIEFQNVRVLVTFMILVCRGVIRQNGLEDAPVQMMSFAASNQHATATCERIHYILKFHAFANHCTILSGNL
jgi:hypothetical protein